MSSEFNPTGTSTVPEKRYWKYQALQAALKMSSVGEPEVRLVERAKVIFDFLYGSEAN
jgi:hypothetical protein